MSGTSARHVGEFWRQEVIMGGNGKACRRIGGFRGVARVLALGALLAIVPALASAATVPPNGTKLTTQTEILADKRIAPMLSEQSAAQLEALAGRYRDIIADGGFPKVPNGTYKKGKQGKGVGALNRRLYMEGYLRVEGTQGEYAELYTSATEEGVRRYQRNHGLEVSGKIDGPTLKMLNVPAELRLRTIEANIERLRTYSADLGSRYLVVNVPSQQIEAVSGGYVYSRHNAVVGREDRPTPVVATALSDVIFNPYWNAPASIVERDLIPKLLSDRDVLEDMNIKVFQGFGGPEIDPRTVNWRTAIADDYHFRQEPGEGNAMATAKINFPSPFGIYLHDTPDKVYFTTNHRLYSSGCVRVDKVAILLDWILNGQDGLGSAEISAYAETLENREVKLLEPPQLRVTYLTAWPVGNTVAFRPDVYDLDGTGFVMGQPMPVGELSDDGQRFVLKPVPRKPSAVDADEFQGFTLFGSRRNRNSSPTLLDASGKPRKPSLFGGLYEEQSYAGGRNTGLGAKKTVAPAVAVKKTAVEKKPKTVTSKKDKPGLFDWDAYRKSQKKTATTTKKKPAVKKEAAKKAAVEEKKVASTTKKATDAKAAEAKAAAKKATDTEVASKKPAAPKKETDKKLDCKPGTDGKLPKGCPPAVVAEKKKPKPEDAAAAN
jgi:hypothetical protein